MRFTHTQGNALAQVILKNNSAGQPSIGHRAHAAAQTADSAAKSAQADTAGVGDRIRVEQHRTCHPTAPAPPE